MQQCYVLIFDQCWKFSTKKYRSTEHLSGVLLAGSALEQPAELLITTDSGLDCN